MPLRILLVSPPNLTGSPLKFEPLGLVLLASFIKKYSDHEIDTFDCQLHPPGALEERVAVQLPHVVGVSALFQINRKAVLESCRQVRKLCPTSLIVIGGMDAGSSPEEYFRCDAVDVIVYGHGEETFLELLHRHSHRKNLKNIAGTVVRDNSGFTKNPPRKLQINYDDYPFPNRELLDTESYYGENSQNLSFPLAREHPAVLIQSSRGCPIRCSFCEIISIFDTWLAHSPEYVVGEIQNCQEQLGAKEFIFLDDNFMVKTNRVLEICDKIIKNQLNISIDVLPGISIWTLSENIIDRLMEAGLYRVCLPIESANPKTLKYIGKPVNLDKVQRMIEYCNRKGLFTFANLILGFPFETQRDLEQTVTWGKQSGLDAINYLVATPLKGSKMYQDYLSRGWIQPDFVYSDQPWRTRYFHSNELRERAFVESSRYLLHRTLRCLRPDEFSQCVLPKLRSPKNIRYLLRVLHWMLFSKSRASSPNKLFCFRKLVTRPFVRELAGSAQLVQ